MRLKYLCKYLQGARANRWKTLELVYATDCIGHKWPSDSCTLLSQYSVVVTQLQTICSSSHFGQELVKNMDHCNVIYCKLLSCGRELAIKAN